MQGIQKYDPEKLPKNYGEEVYFEDIGSAVSKDYDVEGGRGCYKITLKS